MNIMNVFKITLSNMTFLKILFTIFFANIRIFQYSSMLTGISHTGTLVTAVQPNLFVFGCY